MNITFTPQPIPELTIDGGTLAELGFTPGTPLQLTLRPDVSVNSAPSGLTRQAL